MGVSQTDSWPLNESTETGWEIFYTGIDFKLFFFPQKFSLKILHFVLHTPKYLDIDIKTNDSTNYLVTCKMKTK